MLRQRRLKRAFYQRDAVTVARDLLGSVLVFAPTGEAPRAARIVETEAYGGPEDRACHASRGLTKRTKTLLGPAGRAYIYLIYGMYDCFNVVCGGEGQRGHAVLVRGVEPLLGIDHHARTDGPGRLSMAYGLTRTWDAKSLLSRELFLANGDPPAAIEASPRVGVAYAGEHAERPWRFFDPDSTHVSRPTNKSLGLGGVVVRLREAAES